MPVTRLRLAAYALLLALLLAPWLRPENAGRAAGWPFRPNQGPGRGTMIGASCPRTRNAYLGPDADKPLLPGTDHLAPGKASFRNGPSPGT